MAFIVNVDGVDYEFKRMDWTELPFPKLTIQLLGYPTLHLNNAEADPQVFYMSATELINLIQTNKDKT